ncbi:MAG: lamin tail domain-containing protein [Flavobacteriales bacterium]|nr:lamin tail domain-containing protein [Flavobacteriales bacterium]
MRSQVCTELFISEYLEGSNNDKALELYNPTPYPIDLSQYRLIRWANGSITADLPGSDGIQPLGGIIPPFGTWVISLGIVVGGGTTGNPTDSLLMAIADTVYTSSCQPGSNPPQPRAMCFNGDDALSLQKIINPNGSQTDPTNWKDVDIFGIIGEQPTNASGTTSPTAGWTALDPYWKIPANYNSSVQGPYFKQYWTQNHKMIRKATVQQGVTTRFPAYEEPGKFNPATEWDSLPAADYISTLGSHTCTCTTYWSTEEVEGSTVSLYPSPASSFLNLRASEPMVHVRLLDPTGRALRHFFIQTHETQLSLEGLPLGVLLVEIHLQNGQSLFSRLIHVR